MSSIVWLLVNSRTGTDTTIRLSGPIACCAVHISRSVNLLSQELIGLLQVNQHRWMHSLRSTWQSIEKRNRLTFDYRHNAKECPVHPFGPEFVL
jgi:hypothetical protein